MLVESHAGVESEYGAGAAQLLDIIGNIQTAAGFNTLRRAGGVAVQVMAGDPVCQGDVIETAADGRVGIRFTEGTVLNLFGGTCVVLNEFGCDSIDTSQPALFSVIRGSFAFVAGREARKGCLTIDTPVGSVRSWGRDGGIGMVSLAALAFSIFREAQAAGPEGTLLDDDNISYKDLEHGAFELVTKEAVPRTIIVEDPGETVVLSKTGSSVSVNQVTNTAARMEELQAAQQDVVANLTKGQGPSGSSTPPATDPLPIQRINFIKTDTSPAELESLSPMPATIQSSVTEDIIGSLPPPPPPSPPTFTTVAGPIETDTVVFDAFTATSGTLAASSSISDAVLTFGISGGTAGTTVVDGATYDVSQTGTFGTLYVNSTTGAYTFVPDDGAINALTTTADESFTVTVSDGALSAETTFTITFNGTNDAANISGNTTGSLIEAGTAAAPSAAPIATGTLTSTDVDHPSNTFTAVGSATASAGGYGTFTITQGGVWTYALDEGNGAVQALNVGDTLIDTFTVTTIDGTPQTVTITIGGANDAAIISGATTGSVIEAGGDGHGKPTACGTLTATDVDNPSNTFTAVSCATSSAGGYGTFTMTAAGVWTYTLDDANCDVQALGFGEKLVDTFTVTSIDGTAQVVTITIHGSSDADPNDFDHLATGNCVEFDPPYVFGTPRSDHIAGGCEGQIIYAGAGDDTINATGECDQVYGGSGNDTIKGNEGGDTIYGGSGGDTINANNGCDTIIGGYGADCLSGGYGDDRFTYLSVADSSAAWHDTIFDFKSGSDKIDLTAFGTLGFVSLTSTGASAPAQSIAVYYDNTANETIVYVNPTDQALDIGESGLLEIHVQGVATIQTSDFETESGEPTNLGLVATTEIDAAAGPAEAGDSFAAANDPVNLDPFGFSMDGSAAARMPHDLIM